MVYTPQSYLDTFKRSYKADGHKLQLLKLKEGPVWRILVAEGPKDVWELTTREVGQASHERVLGDGEEVTTDGQQEDLYNRTSVEMTSQTGAIKKRSAPGASPPASTVAASADATPSAATGSGKALTPSP
eukprot:6701975-Alexandrium_andersonii.AAC.1